MTQLTPNNTNTNDAPSCEEYSVTKILLLLSRCAPIGTCHLIYLPKWPSLWAPRPQPWEITKRSTSEPERYQWMPQKEIDHENTRHTVWDLMIKDNEHAQNVGGAYHERGGRWALIRVEHMLSLQRNGNDLATLWEHQQTRTWSRIICPQDFVSKNSAPRTDVGDTLS